MKYNIEGIKGLSIEQILISDSWIVQFRHLVLYIPLPCLRSDQVVNLKTLLVYLNDVVVISTIYNLYTTNLLSTTSKDIFNW